MSSAAQVKDKMKLHSTHFSLSPVLVFICCLICTSQAASLRQRRQLDREYMDRQALQEDLQRALDMLETKRALMTTQWGDVSPAEEDAGDNTMDNMERILEEREEELEEEAEELQEEQMVEKVKEEITETFIEAVQSRLALAKAEEEALMEEKMEEAEERKFENTLATYLSGEFGDYGDYPLTEAVDDRELSNVLSRSEEEKEEELEDWMKSQYDNELSNYLNEVEKRSANNVESYAANDLPTYLRMPIDEELLEETMEEPVDLNEVAAILDQIEDTALLQSLDFMDTAQSNGYNADTDPFYSDEMQRLNMAFNAEKIKQRILDFEGSIEEEEEEEDEEIANISNILEELPLGELENVAQVVDEITGEREKEALQELAVEYDY